MIKHNLIISEVLSDTRHYKVIKICRKLKVLAILKRLKTELKLFKSCIIFKLKLLQDYITFRGK